MVSNSGGGFRVAGGYMLDWELESKYDSGGRRQCLTENSLRMVMDGTRAADLPGLKKEEVKVEVEEGGVLQISGERSKEQEEKNGKWRGAVASSFAGFGCRKMPRRIRLRLA
ncbi:18.1 kDa class I heat shock protein-like [Forsythia ovata]|uniref:18.1 kDa class I heat shock protein-like n=1 Tax=Forsythia ovata TaxID=205694 RepID=A0ABD1NWD6_9LAMI